MASQQGPDQSGVPQSWTATTPPATSQSPYPTTSSAPSGNSSSNHSPHLSHQPEQQTSSLTPYQPLDSFGERPPHQYRSTSLGPHIRPRSQEDVHHYSSATHTTTYPADDKSASYASLYERHVPSVISSQENETLRRRFPLEDPREACLFRYFVEEIAHWVSRSPDMMCDKRRPRCAEMC